MPYQPLDPSTATALVFTRGQPLVSVGETLASLRTNLSEELGSRTDLTPTQYNRWINWAYRHLCGMLDLKILHASEGFSSVVAQGIYSLPEVVSWIRRVSVTDSFYPDGGRPLRQIDEALYRRSSGENWGSMNPTAWFRTSNLLVLWPAPISSLEYTVDYKLQPADLTLDTDSPILPVVFHEPLLVYAKYRALRATRQFAASAQAMNEATSLLRGIQDPDAEERANAEQHHVYPARSASDLYRRG